MSRPEHIAPPEVFYNDSEARKYTNNSRIATIQAEMAIRALELLNLPPEQSCLLLDVGCGSGLSGEVLEEEGHTWVGMDISPSMLEIAQERDVEGDLFLQDAGQGMGYRPGVFDGAISISALQWLCNADTKEQRPKYRLSRFFSSLYSALAHGSRAVFQFYPENDDQLNLIMSTATHAGFTGGLVIDYPNSKKAKKYYLCLFSGQGAGARQELPRGLGTEADDAVPANGVKYSGGHIQTHRSRHSKRSAVKDRDWVIRKKESARAQGKKVANDSKYTGRRRPRAF